MCPCKLETGQGMVEVLFFEPDDLEIKSVMVTVTRGAIFPLYFRRCVVSLVQGESCFQLRMTGEAFGVCHLIAQLMATGTFRQSFQVGVVYGEGAGRDLGQG